MEEFVAEIDKLVSSVSFLRKNLVRAKELIEIMKKAISSAEAQMANSRIVDAASASQYAKEAALEAAPGIFVQKLMSAVAINDEFAYETFLSPLREVSEDDSLYQITQIGGGWNSTVSVNLAMNEVAGTIDEYAEGVDAAREAFGIKEGRDPVKASFLWRTRFYRGPRYFHTINLRLSSSMGKAPFWSLLNDGNKINMASDIGGTPYPNKPGTHFVQEIEEAIKQEYLFTLRGFKEQNYSFINDMQVIIARGRRALSRLLDAIAELDSGITTGGDIPILERIATRINRASNVLSEEKIFIARDKIAAGEYVPAQISIQGPGQKRVRIRRKKFIESISSFRE